MSLNVHHNPPTSASAVHSTAKRRALGEDNPETLDTETNLASSYKRSGDYEKAEPLYAAALAAYRRVLGDTHDHTVNAINGLADLCRDRGDLARSEALFNQAVEAARRGLGDEHPRTLDSMMGLARSYAAQGHYAQAEQMLATVLDSRRRVLGPERRDTLNTAIALADARLKQHEYAAAGTVLRNTLKTYERVAPDDFERYRCQGLPGATLAGEKKYAEGEPLLLAGYDGMVKVQDNVPAADRRAISDIAQRTASLYQAWGQPDKAAEWVQRAQRSPNGESR